MYRSDNSDDMDRYGNPQSEHPLEDYGSEYDHSDPYNLDYLRSMGWKIDEYGCIYR